MERKQDILKSVLFCIKVLFFWCYLFSFTYGMSHKIDRSFKLIFWEVEIGRLDIKAEILNNSYTVTSLVSARGIISLFSKILISSGAEGSITDRAELIPSHSITKWHLRGKSQYARLTFSKRELVSFFHSPDLKKPYHIINPTGIKNGIDPVSLMLWFLLGQNKNQLCDDQTLVVDGFRMSEVVFVERIDKSKKIICQGIVKRVLGFKSKEKEEKPLKFKVFYLQDSGKDFLLSKFEVETVFGKIKIY